MRSRLAFLFLLSSVMGSGAVASEPKAVEDARETIGEWVQTRKLISEEQTAWKEEEQALAQSIGLLEKELESLTGRLDELEAAEDETEARTRSLNEKNEAFRAASAEAGDLLAVLEKELQELRSAFPVPLENEAAPLFDRLDESTKGRSVALGQRLQTVLAILAEVSSFQESVTLSRETRVFGENSRREVQTIYLGFGQAFFVDANQRVAGSGRPTIDGWEWTRDDELAAAVSRAVSILENQRTAEFIDMPVEVAK